MSCPSCGTANREGARNCNHCGKPLPASNDSQAAVPVPSAAQPALAPPPSLPPFQQPPPLASSTSADFPAPQSADQTSPKPTRAEAVWPGAAQRRSWLKSPEFKTFMTGFVITAIVILAGGAIVYFLFFR